jgi:hypothetical protein
MQKKYFRDWVGWKTYNKLRAQAIKDARKHVRRETVIQRAFTCAFSASLGIAFSLGIGLAMWSHYQAVADDVKCECQCEERGDDNPAPVIKESKTTVTLNPTPQREYENEIERMICFFDDWDCEVMYAIARAESGGRCDAINYNSNGSSDKGVLQVNSVHGFTGDLFNCEYNIKRGHEIWLSQGYGAWTVFNTGKYLEFIK